MSEQQTPTPPPPEPPPAAPAAGEVPQDARNIGMLCHLTGLVGFIGPLLVWLIKKDEHPYIDEQGKEALNFQITMAIAYVACMVLMVVVIGIFLLPIVAIVWFVFTIVGTVKASSGEGYRYPIAIRLIK